jgi:hypothetical protein
MPIDFICACGKKLSAKVEHAGKKAKCPACGSASPIPGPADWVVEVVEYGPRHPRFGQKAPGHIDPERSEMAKMYLDHAEKELKKRKKEPAARTNISWGRDGEGGFLMFGVHFSATTLAGASMLVMGIICVIYIALFPAIAQDYTIMYGAIVCSAMGAITLIKAVFYGEED